MAEEHSIEWYKEELIKSHRMYAELQAENFLLKSQLEAKCYQNGELCELVKKRSEAIAQNRIAYENAMGRSYRDDIVCADSSEVGFDEIDSLQFLS